MFYSFFLVLLRVILYLHFAYHYLSDISNTGLLLTRVFLQRSISKFTSCSDSPSQSSMKALSEMQGCKYSTSDEPTVYVPRTFYSTCVLIECVKVSRFMDWYTSDSWDDLGYNTVGVLTSMYTCQALLKLSYCHKT